ncbi:site-specific integrase [Ramlibacter monticola]
MREGQSQNTLASYRAALRYWAGWFSLRYGVDITLPVPAAAVLQFIVDHAQRSGDRGLLHELPAAIDHLLVESGIKGQHGPLSLNTVVHRIAVLSKAHQLREVKNPCQDPKVRELLSLTRRAYAKRGALPQKKDALTLEPLQAVLATCDDSLRGKRDRALLLFAWSTGGRRRSEVASADMAFLKSAPQGEFVYQLCHSKTNQSGQDRPENYKPVVGDAAQALREWLDAAQIREGRIFREVRRGNHLGDSLSGDAVADIVRKHCSAAGVAGDFSAHSLRSGFITAAGQNGAPLAETMALSGHRSAQTVLGYTRVAANTQGTLARKILNSSAPLRKQAAVLTDPE